MPEIDWQRVPTFGDREPGAVYAPRPSVYALATNAEGRIAAMRTRGIYFLPGGGIDAGETPEEGLIREVREECGVEIDNLRRVGEAVEYLRSPDQPEGIAKRSHFFAVTFRDESPAGGEDDHELVWLTPDEAAARLHHGSAAWAVRRLATPPSGTVTEV